jgi:hypothetical protein
MDREERPRREKPPPTPDGWGRDIDRIRANRELGRIKRALDGVRVFLFTLAPVGGILVAFYATGRTPRPLYAALFGAAVVICLVGGLRIYREPALWTCLAALLGTAAAVAALNFLALIFALGAWAAFGVVQPARRLMAENPDLRITKKLRRERPARPRG